jgi:NADP-dependent 3-hydroxy acid dehydrogenase YdfG
MKRKICFVTGATSGFGSAIAEKFAAGGWNIIINGRRKERLEQFSDHLRSAYGIEVKSLCFDVQKKEDVFAHINNLPNEWKNIDILVNNAGLALGRDYVDEASIEDWDTMIDTNVKGMVYVSKAVLPFMIEHKKGHIINLGSTAGREVYEKGNMYCATKHAVVALSHAMRIDLLRHGIKVTCINPGAAETEFSLVRFKGDEATARSVYQGYKPMSAGDIADIAWYCGNLPAHLCINDLIVTSLQQADCYYFYKK